jgi:uncharacterized surface protein with fasciclin (FAS1) repeats
MKSLKIVAGLAILAMPLTTTMAGNAKHNDIVDVAAGKSSFTTLVTALKAADLVTTLQGKGPYTVFAPTNEAFSKVPEDVLNDLLKPENKAQLQAVLTYHVVAGSVDAKTAMTLSEAATVQGEDIQISLNGQKVMINDAQVLTADIGASNGIIHVIDTVILPPESMQQAQLDKINKMISDNPTAAGPMNRGWDYNLQRITNPSFGIN